MSKKKVVIIGAGPAGLFTALNLVENTDLHITVIDSGKDIFKRTCPLRDGKVKECINCKPCGIMHGFGGAGTFSDCKLSLTPYGVGGDIVDYIGGEKAEECIKKVEETYDKFDNNSFKRKIIGKTYNENIEKIKNFCNTVNLTLTKCPTKHLGTDGTYEVMKNMYNYLLKFNNIEFLFDTKVHDIDIFNNKYNIFASSNKEISVVFADYDYVVIAPGRSGNIWLSKIADKLNIRKKKRNIDIGVRVETLAENVKTLTDELYDMKISYFDKNTGIKIRTFCTNPNGFVSEEHYQDEGNNYAVVNGHSFADKKSNNTNFALLVTLPDTEKYDSEYLKTIVKLSNKINKGKIIYQDFVDFEGKENYNKNTKIKPTLKSAIPNDLNYILPSIVCKSILRFMKKLSVVADHSILDENTLLYGVEAKFYSDIIEVNENFETNCNNIYCIGDGAGISRGITQAASMGIIVADNINQKEMKNEV